MTASTLGADTIASPSEDAPIIGTISLPKKSA